MRRRSESAYHAIAGLALLGLIGIPGLPGGQESPPPAEPAAQQASARFEGVDARFRRGCHTYSYRYSVVSPTPDWQLESRIHGPGGVSVGSDVIIARADPTSGTKTFRLCRRTNKPGVYRITGLLTYADYPETHSVPAVGDSFVLEKARKKKRRR